MQDCLQEIPNSVLRIGWAVKFIGRKQLQYFF